MRFTILVIILVALTGCNRRVASSQLSEPVHELVDLNRLDKESFRAQENAFDVEEAADELRVDYALAVFKTAKEFELYSLDPKLIKPGSLPSSTPMFHGWQIIGQRTINDHETRDKLHSALLKTILDERKLENTGYLKFVGCYNPRHGIRVQRKTEDDLQTFDWVICIECDQIEIFENNLKFHHFNISVSPLPEFDEALKIAGLDFVNPK